MKNLIKSLSFIGVLLSLFNESASIVVECKYGIIDYVAIDQKYRCEMKDNLNITSPDNATITSVTGIHQRGKSNNDVEGFRCSNSYVEYFPKGLESVFPNLKAITINNNKIKEVHQSDLKPFPNLELLDLHSNLIEVIEEDLFKFNRKFKLISFSSNPIILIYPNVFDNLNKLRYLWLESLSCMNKYSYDSLSAVKEVIDEAKSKCNDKEYSPLAEKIKNLEIRHDSLNFDEFNQQLVEIEKKFKISNYSNVSTFKKRINKLLDIKEAKEYELKVPQIVKALEKSSSEYQAQTANIQIKLKEFGDILSNITKEMEAERNKKSGQQSRFNDIWKMMSLSIIGLFQTIILIVIYTKFNPE